MLMLEVVSLETSGLNKREVIFSHFIYDVYCEEMFSLSQKKVEKLVLNGFSVFVSGGAGSGKSFFLRCMIDKLRAAGWSVFIVAPTGSLA